MKDGDELLSSASVWVAPATVVAAVAVGVGSGFGPSILVLAGGMLLGAVLLLWSSLGRLTGESPLSLEEAVGLAAPSPEEERKRSILRALKDLDYERSVGKISEEDFAELSARYRSEAKVLLQALDAELEPARKAAEKKLEKRLSAEKIDRTARSSEAPDAKPADAKPADAKPADAKPADAKAEPSVAEEPKSAPPADGTSVPRACPACDTKNDADASFCKKCGAALSSAEATP